MDRLQKKCVIVTVGFHLLLVAILFLGPAFFRQPPPPDNLPILKVIPLTAIDAAMSSGVANPTPPPPQQQPTPTPPEPTPIPPTPVVTPPQPTPEPVRPVEPKPVEPDTPEQQPPDDPTPSPVPVPRPVKKKHVINVDTSKPITRPVTTHHPDTTAQDDAQAQADARAERAAAKKRAAALRNLTSSLEHNLSSSTEVQMPGAGAASYANYGQIVKSIYENAWIPPSNADNDEASPKVHVVIARDGTVISARIISPSGDTSVDASVQRVLDRVTTIRPFPDGATDKERGYNINFDLTAKRMLQ